MGDSELKSLAALTSGQAQAVRRFGAWAGVIGSKLSSALSRLRACWVRGTDPASMYISALSLGPRGWIQITNFVAVGLLIILFAKGLRRSSE